ncbi:HicB family protein [Actinobaculum suis]|uniref:HicB family protein n=2 Tax=Actinobaculum suis TaxID=1657 RepID=A0A1G7BQ81_9ACTO|nr:toxin-antitoxin system HicB family antitoxin [Actinobaculum suis]SDE29127.1 HicB family protein [Actinobaculum suis]
MQVQNMASQIEESLRSVSKLADAQTQETAEKLISAVAPAVELAQMKTMADIVATINEQVPDLELQVAVSAAGPYVTAKVREGNGTTHLPETAGSDASTAPATPPETKETENVTDQARLTLRLPGDLKAHIEEEARQVGMSLNAYIVNVLQSARYRQTEHTQSRTHLSGLFY